VLRHVEREELLLADGSQRRRDGDEEQHEPEREEPDAPARHGLPAAGERSGTHAVGNRDQHDRCELERIERPAREQGGLVHQGSGFSSISSVGSNVKPRSG
jgi:hypothetical protein